MVMQRDRGRASIVLVALGLVASSMVQVRADLQENPTWITRACYVLVLVRRVGICDKEGCRRVRLRLVRPAIPLM